MSLQYHPSLLTLSEIVYNISNALMQGFEITNGENTLTGALNKANKIAWTQEVKRCMFW